MKMLLRIVALIVVLLLIAVLYIFTTTGFFRKIENTYSGSTEKIEIPGAEDFAIDRSEGILIVSSDDRAARRDGRPYESGLYFMDLNGDSEPVLLEAPNDVELYPHGISLLRLDSQTLRILVVNHVSTSAEAVSSMDPTTKHSIEEYLLRGQELIHIKTYEDEAILSPNDVVAIDDKRFYFTNDHGSKTKLGLLAEDYLGLKRSNVVYFDGREYKEVASNIAYANGINADLKRDLLYVASPREFKVLVFNIEENGQLEFLTDVDCNSGVDNIELDEGGKVWIGSHPKLLSFSAYAEGRADIAPSEIITITYSNIDEYEVNSIFESDGADMSGSTTAIPYKGKVYLGNVMDDHFLILDQNQLEE